MDLHQEFISAFHGHPWHGQSSLEIVEASDPEKVFVHWIPNAHCIAEIVLHLTVWTEEAVERLEGKEAKTPLRGDWPLVVHADLQGWQRIVKDFKSAHQILMDHLEDFSSEDWDSKTIGHRDGLSGVGSSYAVLVNGIIQHLAYHSGQLSLLQKF